MQNCNFACGFVWLWNVVPDIVKWAYGNIGHNVKQVMDE
jgi:hypothetical protein